MPTLISLTFQVYQAAESVIMTQRVHYFLDLGQSYFYRIKGRSWITAEYLQWTIHVKTKSYVYMFIKKKKTSKKLSRPSNLWLGKCKSFSFIFVFYLLSFTSYRYLYTAVAVKGYYKCRFFNAHQSLWSPKVIRILIIRIISFTLKQSDWLESKAKIENYNWRL